MSTPPTPTLKSPSPTTASPRPAEPARTPAGNGAPKVVAVGVLSALRPNPHTITVCGIRPGLDLRGMDRGEIPVADWLCTCGHHERARGRAAVVELISRVRVGNCPHHAPEANRRKAA